ncbi:MAG: ATP-binding protein [Gammaproteobacteria bacterium]
MIRHLWLGLISLTLLLHTSPVAASLISYFKDENGDTKWQYVANFSSGVLIILLSITAIVLFFSRREVGRTNKALKQMNDLLEERVKERTATLDESNHKLTETNALLEGEIAEHLNTTKQLQASESYIKSILQSMPIMLVGLDKEDRVTQWNHAAVTLTGIQTAQAMGKDLWEAYPTLPLQRERVHEAIEKNEPVHVRSSQRGQSHFEITIYPLENFIETGLVILIEDVTQVVQSENKLIEKDKLSAMGELSSVMAYDINAPLKSIADAVDGLDCSGDPEATKQAIAALKQQSQRASAIVRNLLDFSGSGPDGVTSLNILDVIDHSIELSSDIFADEHEPAFADIEIERLYEENLSDIPGSQSELQQVFVALLRYSFHAIRQVERTQHSPKITIQVLTSYDALWIKISHNGLGIGLDQQQVIFEPFFSDEAMDEDKQYEASQRLSFPYFIITQHHRGKMAITSNVDIGTTFHLELPLE